MDGTELLDDFVFSPEPWDLAMAIGLRPDDSDREALAELADAMLVWAEGPEVEELTTVAVDAIWSPELEQLIREGLARAAALGDEWRPAVVAAFADLERGAKGAAVSREVVRRLALDVGHAGLPMFFCLCCVDEAVAATPAENRRARALEAALVTLRDTAVPEAEVRAAVAALAPLALATDERRARVRRRLGRLARLGRTSLPALAAELERIAEEPLPDASEDDVWEVVVRGLLAQVAQPEWN